MPGGGTRSVITPKLVPGPYGKDWRDEMNRKWRMKCVPEEGMLKPKNMGVILPPA